MARCLSSVVDLVSETIVVDTGSTDRSREVAAGCGARVVDVPWRDDFAAARNEGLRHAGGSWIFWLDADEWLDEDNRQRLRCLFANLPDELTGYFMRQWSEAPIPGGAAMMVDQVRLFPRHPLIRWQYRVHEQILPALLRLGGRPQGTEVVIRHSGYVGADLRQCKHGRNLRLLHRQYAENPQDAFTLFNLGWTYLEIGRPTEALPWLRRSLDHAGPAAAFLSKLHALRVRAHHRLNQAAAALAACREGRAIFPDDAELLYQEGLLRFHQSDLAGAEICLRRLLESPSERGPVMGVDPGLRGFQARYNLGVIYRDQGKITEAETQWRAVVAECPEHWEAWLGLADLLLAQGRGMEVQALADRLAADPQRAMEAGLVRARVYLHRREFPAARCLLEHMVAQAPGAVVPRQVLSHVLLLEGRDKPAAEHVLRALLTLDPGNTQARHNLAKLLRHTAVPTDRPSSGQPCG